MIATIGYERADLADFLATLNAAGIGVLVDIRDRAQSRRPGFSKSALSHALASVGIQYIHMRELGDPKEGREAARRNDFDSFRKIFGKVMVTDEAKKALARLADLASREKICLMCYERDQLTCHRKIISDHLAHVLDAKTCHLGVRAGAGRESESRRMRDRDQGTTASVQQIL